MPQITFDDVVFQILSVLRETFEGPKGDWSYFTDKGPESGYFGTLQNISAIDASRSGNGTSIASHLHHVVFSLNEASSYIRGDTEPRDWKESWKVHSVDDAAWSALLRRLRLEYSTLQSAIQSNATDSAESMGAAVGFLAHAAFHLGAIRQKVTQYRQQA